MLFAPDESLESNWDQLFRQSETAFQEKNYALAESTLHAALKECANFAENDRRIAETLLKLGKVYLLQNNYQLAEDFFQRSLEMCKAEAGEEALELEPYLASLAHLYRNQRLYEKGEKAMIEIVKIKEKYLGTEHVDVAESLEHLAIYYQFWYTAEDGHSNPEALFRRSLKIKEAALGAENPETLKVLQSLANYLQSEKQYALSEELLARLISARKNTLGDHHPDVAAAQIALADVYKAQKKYADPIYNEILVKAKGPHELEEAATVSMLAKHFRYVTDYKTKVPELYMRSLAIKEKLFGAYHIDLAEDIEELASFYQLQKNYADAAHLLERLCKIYFDNLGPEASDLAETYASLSDAYNCQARYVEALDMAKRALDIRVKTLGDGHIMVCRSYISLGLIHLMMKETEQSKYYYLEAEKHALRTIRNHCAGTIAVLNFTQIYHMLARLYKDCGDEDKSRLYELRVQTLGTGSQEDLKRLLQLYENEPE